MCVKFSYGPPPGHYMEVALVPSDYEGMVGRLKTPHIHQPEDVPMCASFWYLHNGDTNRDCLSVYIDIFAFHGFPLWQEKGKRYIIKYPYYMIDFH